MLPEARCEECHDLLSDWCDPLECNAQNRRKQPHIHHVDRDGRRLTQLESHALMHFYSALVFLVLALIWFGYELGWGGGDPNDPHHHVPGTK